jgi:hypothetical protein
MAVDTMLWVLMAAGAGFIWFGCRMTTATRSAATGRANTYRDRFSH